MKTPSALVFLLLSALPGFSGAPGVLDAADFGAKPDDGVNDLLALRLAGLSGRLYAGSWSEWSSDPTLPVATGAEPG